MGKKQKKGLFRSSSKIIFVLFFALFFAFSPLNTKRAEAWDAMPAAIFKQAQEEIMYAIKGMMMGSLKQAAVKMLSKQMDNFISGVSGNGARFITNWEDYLIDNPTRNAQRYANDYISRAMSGRGSVSYKKASNSVLGASTMAGEGFGKEMVLGTEDESGENYQEKLSYMLNDTVVEPVEKPIYNGEPDKIFEEEENLAAMNEYIESGVPSEIQMNVATEYNKKLEEEKTIAAVEAGANAGFVSEKVDGMVVKPGKLFQEMQANTDNLPNLAMSSATSIGELIAATVSKAISGAVNKAVSGVEKKINREVTKVTNKATKEVNKSVNAYGPGALYQ